MKQVSLGSVPAGDKAKIDWCVDAIQQLANATRENDPNVYADDFTPENVTESRTFDADTVTVAQLADVVGTFIDDFKNRGSKRT